MKLRIFVRTLWQTNKVFPVTLIVLVLGCLALFAVDTWVLTPGLQKLQSTYIAQRELVRGADTGQHVSVARRLQKDRKDLEAFRETVGGYDEFTDFVGELFLLAEKVDLSIDRVKYDPEGIEEHNLLRYNVSFSVAGDYGEIKKFIFSLEQSKRIIVIEEVALAGGNKSDRSPVDLQIRLSTYFATGKS